MKRSISMAAIVVAFSFALIACSNNPPAPGTPVDKKGELAKGEMYTCTMHNEVMSNNPGTCPKCGMALVKQKMTPEQEKMMKEGSYVKSKEEQ